MAEYIERKALIEKIVNTPTVPIRKCYEGNFVYADGTASRQNEIIDYINEQPTADVVEVKHGYWKEPKGGGYQCSNCRAFFDDYYGFSAKEKCIYCPTCGAKMDLEERK